MFDLSKPWPLGLDRHNWPLYLGGLGLAILLTVLLDVWASQASINWPDSWRAPFFFITDYGLADWTLIPSLVIFVLASLAIWPVPEGQWRLLVAEIMQLSAFVFLCIGFPGLVVTILKRLFGRARPHLFEDQGAFGHQVFFNDWQFQSFPSGHSQTAISMAFAIGFLFPRLFGVFAIIGIVVAISRVPVGAHYPSDIVGGLAIGVIGSYLVRNVFAERGWLFAKTEDGRILPTGFPAFRQVFAQRPER